jgi:hypothetical protein
VGRTVDDEVKLAHEGFRDGRARMRAHDHLPDMSVFERRNTPTPRILGFAFDTIRKLERAT